MIGATMATPIRKRLDMIWPDPAERVRLRQLAAEAGLTESATIRLLVRAASEDRRGSLAARLFGEDRDERAS